MHKQTIPTWVWVKTGMNKNTFVIRGCLHAGSWYSFRVTESHVCRTKESNNHV